MMIFNSQIKPKDSGVGESVNHTGVNDNAGNQSDATFRGAGVGVPFHNVTYFHTALETTVSSSKSKESPSFIWRLSKP
jgi:hypothetical protein